MKHLKKFNESVLGNLLEDTKSEWYKYLGKTGSDEWSTNLQSILNRKHINITPSTI